MSQDERSSSTPEHAPEPAGAEGDQPTPTPGKAERESTFTRRALLQAGWTAPVIIAATMPGTAYAQTPHTDHTDVHSDIQPAPHSDTHTDHIDSVHVDIPPHQDVPHNDVPHNDFNDAFQDAPA